ncbi:MAG: hypothetical protein NVS3B18_13880 [Candidatus Dormibacteria bacterium]
MRSVKGEIEAAGARLFFVGSGAPPFARDFQQTYVPDCEVFSDPSGDTYTALGARSGLVSTLGPSVMRAARRARKAGFSQGRTQGRAFVQGGVMVALPGDLGPWSYLSEHAGDHPEPAAVVEALRAALIPA